MILYKEYLTVSWNLNFRMGNLPFFLVIMVNVPYNINLHLVRLQTGTHTIYQWRALLYDQGMICTYRFDGFFYSNKKQFFKTWMKIFHLVIYPNNCNPLAEINNYLKNYDYYFILSCLLISLILFMIKRKVIIIYQLI